MQSCTRGRGADREADRAGPFHRLARMRGRYRCRRTRRARHRMFETWRWNHWLRHERRRPQSEDGLVRCRGSAVRRLPLAPSAAARSTPSSRS